VATPADATGVAAPRKAKHAKSAYMARQVAQLILPEYRENPHLSGRDVARKVAALGIFKRKPRPRFFGEVVRIAAKLAAGRREFEMAAIEGYAAELIDCGHQVHILYATADEMRVTRLKAHEHIFKQQQADGQIDNEAVFDKSLVDLSDIHDGEQYYAGFLFSCSVAEAMASRGRLFFYADGSHMLSTKGLSSGTYFEVTVSDQDGRLFPLVAGHSMGNENEAFWSKIFAFAKAVPGFDVPGRVVAVDMEKGIAAAFEACFDNAEIFLDQAHVVKNMMKKLPRDEKEHAESKFLRAVKAPTKERADQAIRSFGPVMGRYLARFPPKNWVRAYSRIEELAEISSHGAEASMSTALRTGIRNFEPLAMIMACAEFAKRKIEKMMGDANNWKGVVPPSVQEHIGKHIEKAEVYEGQVEAIPGSNMYEYNVEDSDGPKRVVLSPTMTQTPPECCAYSQMGNGFPCLHSIAVIVEKHGPGNVYKFIDERYLTQAWKSTYDGIEVRTPAQHSIDAVMRAAKDRVISGDYLLGPKALAPPRGRPVKNAGTRRKSYYERASGSKDARSYRCRLCRKAGHTRSTCKNQ
jgi:hypothetical protein